MVELQQGVERGPVEVTGVSADNPGFVRCTEIGNLVCMQLVAEINEVLSAIQPIRRHGCHTPRDGQPGQRMCWFALPEPALLPRGHCGAVVVRGAWECRRYCFELNGRELVLTCCWFFGVCGICLPAPALLVMSCSQERDATPYLPTPAQRYSYVPQNFTFVRKRTPAQNVIIARKRGRLAFPPALR